MGGEGVSYTYRGNHQGPDLFDEPIIRGAYPSAYDEQVRQEREAAEVIANFALVKYRQDPRLDDFVLAGPGDASSGAVAC